MKLSKIIEHLEYIDGLVEDELIQAKRTYKKPGKLVIDIKIGTKMKKKKKTVLLGAIPPFVV